MDRNGWQVEIKDPIEGRTSKPREKGLTMVIDKGIGIGALKDLLEISGEYLDFLKFAFGSSLVYPHEVLKKKINLVRKYDVEVYPGGTLFEVAVSQNRLNEYLFRAKQLGFTAIEISNGTIELPEKVRKEAIFKANSLGFKVLTEVGKKDRENPLSLTEMKRQISEDKENGAYKIIIEGRESGKGVSIYKDDGSFDKIMMEGILSVIEGEEDILIWEAPLKKQQAILINQFGPNVNLGNIQFNELVALEALRRGLRGDTFRNTLVTNEKDLSEERIIGA